MAAASQKLGVGVFAFPPSKPPVLSVAPGNAAISLSWNEVDTATQYKIFRSTTSGAFNYDQPIAKISTHLWSDLTATNGTPFFYEVRAGNNAGDTESSNEVNAQAISSFSISSANMSGSRLTFSFSSATGAETYTVKYGISSRNYTSTASTNATSPFVLNGLTAGNTYFIRVSAVNSVGSGNSIDNDRELVVRPIGAFAFSGSSATSKSITVNWASAVGASAYSLRYGTVSGSYPNILAATSATSAKVTGLDPGNPYYFSVEATNTLLGSTPVTSELSVSTAPPPQTPTGLTASGKTSSIDLEWNSAIGASAYTVYRSVSSGSGYAPVPECTGILVTTCTDTTVVNGVAYYYVVQSSDVELVSSFSSEASARAFSPFTMSSALVSNTAGPNAIALAWQAAAGAEGYTITWGTGGSSSGAGSTTTTGTTATIGSLTAGTAYTFRVTATNTVGSGSSIPSTNTLNATPMTRPSITSITQTGGGQAALVWSGGSGSSSFTVKYGASSGSYPSTASTSATSPYTVTGLTPGSLNSIMVTAVNSSGSLNASAETSINPLPAPAAPTGLTAIAGAATTTLTWNSVATAATYTVYRSNTSGSGYSAVAGCSAITATSCADSTAGLTARYYVIQASNIGGPSPNSPEINTQGVGTFSVSTPTTNAVSATLTWTAASGASAYTIRYGTSSGSYTNTFSTTATSPTTVTGLSSSTQYYFKVEGTNSKFGYQAANAEVSATTGPPPQTPAGLAAVGGVANVSLTWNTAIGASTYTILRSTTSGSGYTALSSCTSIATTTCTDLTALNGTSYYYVVRSEGSGLLSANSSEVSAQPISSFSISSAAVTESGGPNSLVLSWGVATGATSYSITWGTGGSATGTGSTTTPGTTATIGSLTAGTAYTFKVTATNPVGSGTSVAASSTLNGTPMTRPSITSITQTGGGQAALVWSGGSGSSSFTVKYGGSSGSYSSTASTSATSPYTLNGLTPGSLNYVMVTAVNSSGSLNANAETSINPLPAPAAPTGLTATGGTSSISIVWSASTNAATYTLYRSTVSGSGYAAVSGCTAITGLTCIDSSAPAGMNYYVVTATNIGGTSPNSAEASVNYAPVILVNFTDKDGNARSGFTLLSTTSSGAPAAVGSDLYLTKTIGSTLNNGDPTCTVTLKTYAVTAISGTHFTADTSASGAYVITMNASKKKLSPSSSLFNVTAYSGWNRDQTGTTRTDNGDRYFIARIDSTTCGTVGSSRQAQVNIVDPYYSTVNGYGGGGDFMLSESFYSASPGTGDTYAVVTVQRPLFAGSITNDSSVKVLDLWLDAGASSAQGTDYATSSPTLQYTNNYDGSTVSGGGTGIVDKSSRYVLTFNANETEKEVRIPVASSGANKSFYVRLTPHTFTANTTEGSTTLSSVSDTTDLATGQTISGPGIQGGTTITVSGATVTLSKPAAYTATGNTFQTTRAGSTRAQSIAKVRILNTNGTDTTTTPILRTASPTFYNSTASCYTGSALTPSVVSTTNGSPTLTVTSTSGYTSGMPIAGANIPAKTYVNVSNATTLTLVKEDGTNQNATGSASQTAQVWAFGGGDGTSSKPYLICNSTHWANMVHATRCSGASCNGSSLYFKLMTDFAWGSPPSQLAGFRANLDGNQYLIQGYGVNDTVVPAVNPLFSNTGSATTLSSTTLKNLNVLHSSIIYSGTSNGMGMLYSALNGTGFTFSDLFISGMMDLSGAPASNSRSGFLFGYTSAAYTGNTSMDHLMTAGTFSTRFSSNANGAGGYYSNHTPGASNQLAITNSYNTLNMLFNSSGSTYGTGGIIGQYDQASSGVTTGGINLDKIYVTGFLWNGGASTNPGLGGIIGLVTTQTSPVTIYSSSDFVNNSFTNLSFSGSLHASQSYMGGILGKVAITTGGQSFSINGNSTSGSILNQNTTGQYTGGLIGQFKNNSVATDARLYLNNNTTRNSVTLSGTGTTSYTGGLAGSLKIGNSTAGSNHTFESSNNLSTSAVTLATTSTGASGTFYVGGWVGYLYWSPTNASGVFSKNGASGAIACGTAAYCGGLIGMASGATADTADTHLVDTSYATGNVTSSGTSSSLIYSVDHGGFVGFSRYGFRFYKSFATGSWSDSAGGLSGYGSGGFAGELGQYTKLEKCFSTGSLTSVTATSQIGGLVGRIQQSGSTTTVGILQSWSSGSISATSSVTGSNSGVGGLVGYISGGIVTIDQSYAAGTNLDTNLSADSKAAGFIGTLTSSSTAYAQVTNSYSSITSITGSGTKGFHNSVSTMGICYTNSYYLTPGASGTGTTAGYGTAGGVTCSTTSATQVTAAALQNPSSSIYNYPGWDTKFTSASPSWNAPTNGGSCTGYTCPSSTYSYPTLYWCRNESFYSARLSPR